MRILNKVRTWAGVAVAVFLLASCDKEEMVVDRIASPVLVTIAGTEFAAAEPVQVTASFYELNKAGLLDHTVGIDSIPVSNLAIEVKANGAVLESLTTDANGEVALGKTWPEMGIAAPVKGNTVSLAWSGTYKGQAFTKMSRIQVK